MKYWLMMVICIISLQSQAKILYKCTENNKVTYQEAECKNNKGIQEAVFVGAYEDPPKTTEFNSDLKATAEQPAIINSESNNTVQVERDAEGHIKRSETAKNDFKAVHPCPSNGNTSGACPGYVIDHIKALACGGADSPSNMQWQSIAEGKAKDKWERDDCKISKNKPDYDAIKEKSERDRVINIFNHSSGNRSGNSNSSSESSSPSGYSGDRTIQTGERGGKYYINSSGNKEYIKRK